MTKDKISETEKVSSPTSEFVQSGSASYKPLVSIILPALNEEAIIIKNLDILYDYIKTLESDYAFEFIIINDGSTDSTGELAESYAKSKSNVFVYHHVTNFGLGQAFKFAFSKSTGDYVITLDIDLSYSPEHIKHLLDKITKTKAKLVLASPYMQGGTINNVPTMRKILSIAANKFLSLFAHGHLSTLTCMVRAYDGKYIRSVVHRSLGMEVMPETVYKSMILRAKIEQIPADLDWGMQNKAGPKRRSSMKVFRHIFSTLLSGFIFRPFMFFVFPGLLLLVFSLHTNFWAFMHFFDAYFALSDIPGVAEKISSALATAYDKYPYTYMVGLLSMMLSIQLIGTGIQTLQSKNYFEELFHLGSRIYQLEQENHQLRQDQNKNSRN